MADSAEALERFDPANVVDIDLEGAELRQNWLDVLSSWARRPPFYARDRHGRIRVVCGRYADVREVQMDRERFSVVVPPGSGNETFDFFMGVTNVAQTDGVDHDRMRRLLATPFGPQAIAALEIKIRGVISEMLDAVEAKGTGEFEAMSDFCSHLIARIVFETMLGFKREQTQAFYEINQALELVNEMAPGDPFPEAYVKAFNAACATIAALVEERRADPGDDVISSLLKARDGGDFLSTDELIGNIFAITAGALTTTAISLGAALYNLCRHPDQLARLQADPALIPAALEECLRYQGPGYLTFARFAVADTEIGGTKIPKGVPIEISQQAANLDPEQYPDPLRFDITRNPKGICTFGGGMHLCIGFRIARTIMRIALEDVLQRFPNIRLADLDYKPTYHGMHGELAPRAIPLRID
jgi:cytochrome P450